MTQKYCFIEDFQNKDNNENIRGHITVHKHPELNSVFTTLGASSHTNSKRQNEDYYATEPKAAEILLE